jgi:hypothetical protein
MPKSLCVVVALVAMLALVSGCGNTTTPGTPVMDNQGAPVSLTMTDDPPAGVQVLFFQVSLTAATLTPASGSPVSLLSGNTPIQIDVTQLQALSAFLSTANVTPGTYNSLNLTFASPELVIFNQSDTSLGSTCAVGSVCQLTPTIDNSATVSFSSSPFPVALSASTPLGLLIDFHLNTVIQSDLSVNLGVANGISVAELPPAPSHPQFGSVTGEVESVSATNNQFTILTAWGRTFTVDTTSSTTFSDFPSSCTTPGIGCVADGQVVEVQVSGVASGGVLDASQVTFVQAAGTQTVEGTIIKILPLPTPAGENALQVVLHRNPSATSGVPLGGVATVTIDSKATWSVDNNGFTLPAGLAFTGISDVIAGQNVQLTVEPGTLSSTSGPNWGGWGPPRTVSFTTSTMELEPSQVTGMISALDTSAESFTLNFSLGPWFAPWPMASANAPSFDVETTSATTYQGFNPESFDGLATQDSVSVSGWLFPAASSGGSPQIAAQAVAGHSGGWF